MQAKLTASDNVLTADLRWEDPDSHAPTAAAAWAAYAALNRGWKPNPGDPPPPDVENWGAIVTGLAADPAPPVISLGHSAVAWLNANGHVASGFTAVLDESGFHISRSSAKPTDMHKIHHRLLPLAEQHAVELNRLHAYMADYDGPYHDLLADLRTEISPMKIEVRARRSPTTLTVPTDAAPDPDDAAQGAPAAEAWITAANAAGFEIQGWGYYFPGCEAEDFSMTCAGVAIGYRWYSLDVVNGTVTARETGTVADHEDLALRGPQRSGVFRRTRSKLAALLADAVAAIRRP